MRRQRVVCWQALVLLAAVLQACRGEALGALDTNKQGEGSYSLISTGEPVRPEKQEAVVGPGNQIKTKAQYAHTAIRIAKELGNPEDYETITVPTRTGDVASLVVKRRGRTHGPPSALDPGSPNQAPTRLASASHRLAKAPAASASASASSRVPLPVNIRSSAVLVKGNAADPKKSRSLMHIDSEGVPVITGVRVPDDEDDKKHTWRGARVINNTLVEGPYKAPPAVPAETEDQSARNPPPPPPALPASLNDAVVKKLAESTAQSPWIPTSPDGANVVAPPILTPQLHGMLSRAEQQRRILEYIRAVNQLEAGRAGARGRMLRNTEAEAQAEARVLHYQPAVLYSTQSTNPSRVVSFEEGLQGVRTPVLQYAHPELGVQPAKVAPPAPAPSRSQDRALAYFGQDIHADRSPYAREPGLDQPEEPVKAVSAKRSSSETAVNAVNAASTSSLPLQSLPQRLKKVQPIEDSYGLASDKYVKRFPHAASSYKDYRDYKDDYGMGYGYRYNSYNSYSPHYSGYSAAHSPFLEDSRPFWVRLSDSIRDSMQTGMERMSDMARPVVDPLMEASAKISQNLGFSHGNGVVGTRGAHGAQDRLGSVAAPSMLLPALGLVAGGAALGLGAVAVGRYLDVDVMAKRSETSDEDQEALEMEHKRALAAIQYGQQRYFSNAAPNNADLNGRQVTDTDVVAQVVGVVNAQRQQGQHQQQQQQPQSPVAHSRTRRDSSANTLDSAELAEERRQLALRAAQLGAPTAVWGSTPCAQRVFCDVLAREGADSALLMEKKMATLLAMLPRVAPEAAAVHLSAVMTAVRRGDCSVFVCPLSTVGSANLSLGDEPLPLGLVPRR